MNTAHRTIVPNLRSLRAPLALAAATALALLAFTGTASAQIFRPGNIPRAPRCVRIDQTKWNVPRGAAVFTTAPGPIAAVVGSLGEQRTHVTISQGTTRGIESTGSTPGIRSFSEDGFCDAPLNFDNLEMNRPGAQTFEAVGFQGYEGNPEKQIEFRRARVFAQGTPLATDWGPGIVDKALGFRVPGTNNLQLGYTAGYTPYFWHQYMNIGDAHTGRLSYWDRGTVCSTFAAFLQGAQASSGGFGAPPMLTPHRYTHDQTNASGYALYASIKTTAGEAISTLESVGGFVGCGFRSPAAHAAAQMRNCMAFDSCRDGTPDRFDREVSNPEFRANSISPDYVAGLTGAASRNSVWASPPEAVHFSSDSTYMCF